MSKSLLEQLPGIVAAGRRQAAQILRQLDGRHRVTLRNRELVIPSADTATADGVRPARDEPPNQLIYGDNLSAMAALLAGDGDTPSLRGKVDLVYIDPPYDSKADYRTTVTLPGPTGGREPTVFEQFAYSDTWADGTAAYLAMITPRLVLMRELLAETGSIYVHLDWHVGHYVKLVLDEVFGRDNFVNEVIWRYGKMSNATRRYPQNHDTLLYYAKARNSYYFRPVGSAESEYKARFARFVVDNKVFHGDVKSSSDKLIRGRIKRIEKELGRQLTDGDVLFDFDREFKTQDDVFYDISIVKGNAAENLRFDTQKPEKLIRRLIDASAPEGGLVADFFVGSGTTAAAAERAGRRWIAADLGKPATLMTRKRLIDQDAKPFLVQDVGHHPVAQTRSTLGRSFRIGDLTGLVLELFGARPLPPDRAGAGNLGRLPNSRTLVFADSPARLTTSSTLRRARDARDSGRFDSVVVLGWNVAAGLGEEIAALDDPGLEVLVVPPDLPDRLKKGAGRLAGEVTFASVRYLQADVVTRKEVGDGEELRVDLRNYVLLSPGATGVDARNRDRLLEVARTEPRALIEYWAVDPDYDGEVFRSVWQEYRSTLDGVDDPVRVATSALLVLPRKGGARRVCVRAVDVFGFESEVVVEDVRLDR